PSESDDERIGWNGSRAVRRRVHGSATVETAMTQDELKRAVAREAIKHVVEDAVIGVGTGPTANFFIDELARRRNRIAGGDASPERSAERLKGHGIRGLDRNGANDLPAP